jgi:polysaccharide biosynthesis protein PslH
MKILHVSPSFPYPPNDGGKIVIYNFYKYLTKSGDDVDFICLNKLDIENENIRQFDPDNLPEIIIDKKISSISRLFRAFLYGQSYLISKFYSEDFLHKIILRLKTKKYDLIQFEGLHTSLYALRIIGRFDIKVVIRLHNMESTIIKRYSNNSKNLLLKLYFLYEYKKIKKIESEIFRKIKNIVFISENDMDTSGINLQKGSHPYVATAGVDRDYFQIKKADTNDLLFLGSMDWKPNENAALWFVENVFGKIIREFPDIKFYIVGKNPSPKIHSLVSDNVIVTGTVEDVRPYLEKTGICIVPLFIGGGIRVKILEFMSSGRPVIATSIGAEGIHYHDRKDILLADDEIKFCENIRFLINNPEEKEKIINNGKELIANEYTWEKVIFNYRNYLMK